MVYFVNPSDRKSPNDSRLQAQIGERLFDGCLFSTLSPRRFVLTALRGVP